MYSHKSAKDKIAQKEDKAFFELYWHTSTTKISEKNLWILP